MHANDTRWIVPPSAGPAESYTIYSTLRDRDASPTKTAETSCPCARRVVSACDYAELGLNAEAHVSLAPLASSSRRDRYGLGILGFESWCDPGSRSGQAAPNVQGDPVAPPDSTVLVEYCHRIPKCVAHVSYERLLQCTRALAETCPTPTSMHVGKAPTRQATAHNAEARATTTRNHSGHLRHMRMYCRAISCKATTPMPDDAPSNFARPPAANQV